MFNILADAASIGDTISTKIAEYLNLVVNFITALPWWAQAIIILFVLILLVLGLIRFIVKSWKLMLALVILAAIGVVVYFVFLKQQTTTTSIETTAATLSSLFLMMKACL